MPGFDNHLGFNISSSKLQVVEVNYVGEQFRLVNVDEAYFNDPIDFEILKIIYGWSCAYIHNGELSYIWQTDWALKYLNTFFKPASSSSAGKTKFSIFGAFRLKNYNSLKTKLDSFIGSDYKILYVSVDNVESIVDTL